MSDNKLHYLNSVFYVLLLCLPDAAAAAFRLPLSVADEGLESDCAPSCFWRTSRIFSVRSCLRGKRSMCLV